MFRRKLTVASNAISESKEDYRGLNTIEVNLDLIRIPKLYVVPEYRATYVTHLELALIIPRLPNFTSSKDDTVILLNLKEAAAVLLWNIYIETNMRALIYFVDLKNLSKISRESSSSLSVGEFLDKRKNWGIVVEILSHNSAQILERYLLTVSDECFTRKFLSAMTQLTEETAVHRHLKNEIYRINTAIKSRMNLKRLFIITVVTLQLSAVIYLTTAIGWDTAEPVSYIISQVNIAFWMLIYVLTGTMPYESFRDYCFRRYNKRALASHKLDPRVIAVIYEKRRVLIEALYKYRKFSGRRFKPKRI